jgi:hypothetical protein
MTVQSNFKKNHFLKLSEIVFKKLNQRLELITKYFRECENIEIFTLLTTTGLTPHKRMVNAEFYFLDNSWLIENKNNLLRFIRIGYEAQVESPFNSNTIFSFNVPSWNKGSIVRKIEIDIHGVHYNADLVYDDHDGIIDYNRIPKFKDKEGSYRSFETEKNKKEGEERIHIFIKNLDNYLKVLIEKIDSDIARINKIAPDIVRQLLNKANNEQEAKAIDQDKTTGQDIGYHRDSLPSSQARFENRTLAEKIAHTKRRLLELDKLSLVSDQALDKD